MRLPAFVLVVLAFTLCGPARVRSDAGAPRGPATPARPVTPADASTADASFAPPPGVACTVDADCRLPGHHGHCFTASIASQYTQSFGQCDEGRAWRAQHAPDTCVYDECRDSPNVDECGPGRRCGTLDMVPFPQRVCVDAACASDLECRRRGGVGARCASYLAGSHCVRGGWACSFPSDPCLPRDPHRMCPVRAGVISYCAPSGARQRFTCVDSPGVNAAQ